MDTERSERFMQILLYNLRKQANKSQQDMADLLHITRTNYGQKERGQLPFSQDEMFEVSSYFGLNIEKIFLPRGYQIGNKEKI